MVSATRRPSRFTRNVSVAAVKNGGFVVSNSRTDLARSGQLLPLANSAELSLQRPLRSGTCPRPYGSDSAIAVGHAAPIERRQCGGQLSHGAQRRRTAGFLFIEMPVTTLKSHSPSRRISGRFQRKAAIQTNGQPVAYREARFTAMRRAWRTQRSSRRSLHRHS